MPEARIKKSDGGGQMSDVNDERCYTSARVVLILEGPPPRGPERADDAEVVPPVQGPGHWRGG
jgi:hypothetical protein